GRVLVSVGPYDPNDTELPSGTETVYDALGRVVKTRKWADVQIELVDLVVNGEKVGKKVHPNANAANAWDGTGSKPDT
ncbi:MAG: hypothetical protein JW749_00375, partial [Sedimentisphaerales bacterium]|nr:hypothetical protein [Sedimentisphaerales bacterium]